MIGLHEKNHSMFHWIATANRMIADAEDLLIAGTAPMSEVGILYPRSSWLWDNATDQTSGAGHETLPPTCVATVNLYCGFAGGRSDMCSTCIDAWPSKIAEAHCPAKPALLQYCTGLSPSGPHGGEDQGSSDMDYMVGVYALFRQLQQVANIAVDFVDEDDLTAAGLAQFKLLITTEPDIPAEGQAALVKWMQEGGQLMTTSSAAAFDRYHELSTVLSDATGVVEAPRERLMVAYASTLSAVGSGTGELGDVTAYGVRGRITSFVSAGDFKVLAKYSSGDPAIVRRMVGKGRVTHFTFFPGIHRHDGSPYHPVPDFNIPSSDGSLPYLLDCVASAGVQARVLVSEQQVETPLLSSADGAVLTLLDWRESPAVTALSVQVRLDYPVEKVTAIQSGTRVVFTSTPATLGGFWINFTLALAHGDFVTLRAKAEIPLKSDDTNIGDDPTMWHAAPHTDGGADNVVAALRSAGAAVQMWGGSATVQLVAGRYQLRSSLEIPSGVSLRGATGSSTVLSGGIAITDWQPESLNGQPWLWRAVLPLELRGPFSENDAMHGWANGTQDNAVRQLWVGGKRRGVARTKLMRFVRALGSGITAKPGQLRRRYPSPLTFASANDRSISRGVHGGSAALSGITPPLCGPSRTNTGLPPVSERFQLTRNCLFALE